MILKRQIYDTAWPRLNSIFHYFLKLLYYYSFASTSTYLLSNNVE